MQTYVIIVIIIVITALTFQTVGTEVVENMCIFARFCAQPDRWTDLPPRLPLALQHIAAASKVPRGVKH